MREINQAVRISRAGLKVGERWLWRNLSIEIEAGEFVAVLGPNGSGKTSLLKMLLGVVPITEGLVEVCGETPHRGSSDVGYVPQRQTFDPDLPLRGRDLVRMGLEGHRFGFLGGRSAARRVIQEVIREVGANRYADEPIGVLSGGEQQRLRIAQALVGNPKVLLCDEPLLSLDLANQQAVSALIDERRRKNSMAVVFVTHEVNPVLPLVDRVLYLVGGKFAVGKPDDVLNSDTLSQLYGSPIDVLKVRGRVVVVGTGEAALAEAGGHHIAHANKGSN